MAGLRNVLVHEYIRVDVAKIYGYLQDRLADFVDFMSHVRNYLERKDHSSKE